MPVVFDPREGGFKTTRGDVDPTTEFGRSKLGKEIERRGGLGGGGASEEDITAARKRLSIKKKLEEQKKAREAEATRKEQERLRKIEEAKAKAEQERKRLQELQEKRERTSREQEAVQRRLSQEKRIRKPTIQRIGKVKVGDPREVKLELELQKEAKKLGRNLTLSEREKIQGQVFGFEVVTTGYSQTGVAKREVKAVQTKEEVPEVKKEEFKVFKEEGFKESQAGKIVKRIKRKIKETRIPILGKTLFELQTPIEARTEIVTLDSGEKAIVPQTVFISPQALPPRDTDVKSFIEPEPKPKEPPVTFIAPTPGLKGKIGQEIGETKIKVRQLFSKLFEPEPSLKPLTEREVAAQVSRGFLITAPRRAGELPGVILEQVAPDLRVTSISPQRTIPTKQTIGGGKEPTIPETKVSITPTDIKEAGGFVGSLAVFSAPAPALISGGAAITTAPTSTGITVPERIEGAFLGAVGVSKGIKFLREPIIKKAPVPEPILKSQLISQPVIKGEKTIQELSFKLTRTTPPRTAEVTTRFRQLRGKKPQIIELTGERVDVSITPGKVTAEKGKVQGILASQRKLKQPTKGFAQLSGFAAEGEAIAIDEVSIKKLSKIEQRLLQTLAERKTGGIPVSIENVPKVLGEDFVFSRAKGTSKKLFKFRKTSKIRTDIRTPTPGKTITRGQSITISKQLEVPEGATFQRFKTLTTVKDVTKPGARATGKVPVIEGDVLILEPKDITPKDSFGIPKKLSTIQKQVQQTSFGLEQAALETLPRVPSPKSIIPKPAILDIYPTKVAPVTTIIPVSTIKAETIPQTKTTLGADNRFIGTAPSGRISSLGASESRLGDLGVSETGLRSLGALDEKTKAKQVSKEKIGEVEKPLLVEGLKLDVGQQAKQQQKERQVQKLRQQQTQKQVQEQAQRQIQQLGQPTPTTKPTTFLPPPIPPPGLPTAIAKAKKAMKEKPEVFEAFTTKFGKEISIGQFRTKPEARKELLAEITTTLRAGGFITKDKKKLRFGELGITSPAFRPSKIDPFKVIEKKEKRIKKGTQEAKEIQFFRKKKPTKRRKKSK